MAVATVPIEDFAYTNEEPLAYESSPGWLRTFCAACGSSVGLHAAGAPKLMDVTLACLDDLSAIVPAFHQYTASQAPYLGIADGLPRHPGVAQEVEELWSRIEGWQQPE